MYPRFLFLCIGLDDNHYAVVGGVALSFGFETIVVVVTSSGCGGDGSVVLRGWISCRRGIDLWVLYCTSEASHPSLGWDAWIGHELHE